MRISRSWLAPAGQSEPGDATWISRLNPFSRLKPKSKGGLVQEPTVSTPVHQQPVPVIPSPVRSEHLASATPCPPARSFNVSRPPSSMDSSSLLSSDVDMVSPVSPLSSSSRSISFSFAGCDPLQEASERLEQNAEHSKDSDRDDAGVLVLTLTSKYPTGVAADLYIPEDCSFAAEKARRRADRMSLTGNSLCRNGSYFGSRPRMTSRREKQRTKRLSLNF